METKIVSSSVINDTLEFTKLRNQCIGQQLTSAPINTVFISSMIYEEIAELVQADKLDDNLEKITGKVDALIDIAYYIFQHLTSTGKDINAEWNKYMKTKMEKYSLSLTGNFFNDIEKIYLHNNSTVVCLDEADFDVSTYIGYVKDHLSSITKLVTDDAKMLVLFNIAFDTFYTLFITDLEIEPIWNLVHSANMTKFGAGGYLDNRGKWNKPPRFIAPDEAIKKEILRQSIIRFHHEVMA